MRRALFERRVLLPLLLGYVALLVVAAWRHEIRPAAFDRATDFARGALGIAGISPGVAVFTADSGDAPDAKIAAICLEVRGIWESGSRAVYPARGVVCPAPPPRLWVRGEAIFLQRAVVALRAAAAARRTGDADPSRARFASLLTRSIGAHFVGRDRSPGETDRYLLLWKEVRVSYRTRARSEHVVALFGWPRVARPRVRVAWQPDEAMLRERGWEPVGR